MYSIVTIFIFIIFLSYIRSINMKDDNYEIVITLDVIIVLLLLFSIILINNENKLKNDMIRVIVENNLSNELKNKDAKILVKNYMLEKSYYEKENELNKKLNLKGD